MTQSVSLFILFSSPLCSVQAQRRGRTQAAFSPRFLGCKAELSKLLICVRSVRQEVVGFVVVLMGVGVGGVSLRNTVALETLIAFDDFDNIFFHH